MNDAQNAPHGDFWNSLTYAQFTTGTVPGVADNAGNPVRILIPGNSAGSAIIQVLRGTGLGSDANFGQMPADGPPYFSAAQIKEIADWIDSGAQQ